jgi:hypothetical protein
MADSIEQLGFELTTAALAEQERALARLKTCAGTVLGASSVAGSYLGASMSNGSLNPWTILALVSFVFCFGCAVWVLLPHYLVFAVGGQELLADSDSREVRDVTEAYRAAARWIEPLLQVNREKVARLSGWLTLSCGLLGAEVVLWTVSLAD